MGATGAQLFAPYGGVRYSSGVMPTSYGFTGQRADASSGLDYYGARYYDPLAGQFTSADTVLPGNGLALWGLSRFAYVAGNPIKRTDPTGHVIVCECAGGGNPDPIGNPDPGSGSGGIELPCGCGPTPPPYVPPPPPPLPAPPPLNPVVGFTCGCIGNAGTGGTSSSVASSHQSDMVNGVAGGLPIMGPIADTPEARQEVGVNVMTWFYDHPEFDPTGIAMLVHVIRDGPAQIDYNDPNTMIAIGLMADGLGGPAGEVVRDRGVRVVIYSNDHGPPHAHVIGGGKETRIGQNGKPLAGDPELSKQQLAVIDDNLGSIRDAIRASMRYYRENKGDSGS